MSSFEEMITKVKENITGEFLGEAWKDHPDPSGFMRAAHDPKNCLLVWWYNIKTAEFQKSKEPSSRHSDDQDFIKNEKLTEWVRGRVFEFKGKVYLMIYFPGKKNLSDTMIIDIFDNAQNSIEETITRVIDDNGDSISTFNDSQSSYEVEEAKLGGWKINESGQVVESVRNK